MLKWNRLSNLLDKKSSLPKDIDFILKVWQKVWSVVAVRIIWTEDDWSVIKIVRAATVDRCLGSSGSKGDEDQGEKESKRVHFGSFCRAVM